MTCILRPHPRWGVTTRSSQQSSGYASSEGMLKHLYSLVTTNATGKGQV